jgi:hypothetical protein
MKRKIVVIVMAVLVLCGTVSFVLAQRQPHMEEALRALQQARFQLEKASHNKGGHRVKAIELINQAMEEVRLGMEDGMAPGHRGR